jgi:hypothetical protein
VSTAEPAPSLDRLRKWVLTHTDFGHPVRTETGRVALGALIRRITMFGLESSVDSLSAAEIGQAVALIGGSYADFFARVALSRAFVEHDVRLIQAYDQLKLEPQMLTWFTERDRADLGAAQELLQRPYANDEERHVTRLLLGRRFPQLITAAWWLEHPPALRIVSHHLCRIAAQRSDLHLPLADFLISRRDVLLADNPDAILAPLVATSATSPQTLLQPFAGLYGDDTVLAAAGWHLEHGQPREALRLAQQIRALSRLAESAYLVSGLACCDLGAWDDARAIRRLSEDASIQDQLDLRLADKDPGITASDIADIARRCRSHQPERFLACLKLLLQRKELALAQSVATARLAEFAGHPVLTQIFTALRVS